MAKHTIFCCQKAVVTTCCPKYLLSDEMFCLLQAHVQLLAGLTSLQGVVRGPLGSGDLQALFGGLPALQACTLQVGFSRLTNSGTPAAFPAALLRCTQLSSLVVTSRNSLLDWGGLPPGIVALQATKQTTFCLRITLAEPLFRFTSHCLDTPKLRTAGAAAADNVECSRSAADDRHLEAWCAVLSLHYGREAFTKRLLIVIAGAHIKA